MLNHWRSVAPAVLLAGLSVTGLLACDGGREDSTASSTADAAGGDGGSDGLSAADAVDGSCLDRPEGAACDDGDPCTADDACLGGQCAGPTTLCACKTSADCAAVGDQLAAPLGKCAPSYYCDAKVLPYRCVKNPATVVVCADAGDTSCMQNRCVPATGQCAPTPVVDGQACDDGDACTVADACKGGGCVAGTDLCACHNDADCAALDDGNDCNGVLYCDQALLPHVCAINPASVIKCPGASWLPCHAPTCLPATGTCAQVAVADGLACDDGQPCTQGDGCAAGACVSGTDTCPCGNAADCVAQDDGDLCNGTLYCDQTTGMCKPNPATVVHCPSVDDTACLQTLCAAKTGICAPTKVNQGGACDDGEPCTASDSCDQGKCKSGTSLCPCKTDTDCASKDDGDLCNGTLYCAELGNGSECRVNPASVVSCPSVDDTTCQKNICQPKSGVCATQPVAENKACDADGTACTPVDLCAGGLCQPDVNTCQCQQNADCAPKEDGDLCNGTLYCDKALAKPVCVVNPATLLSCPSVDDTACTKNQCVAKTGLCAMTPLHDNLACEDGDPCTHGDVCAAGKCQVGVDLCACTDFSDCDDGNPCTVDACGKGGVCVFAAVADGEGCGAVGICGGGDCKQPAAVAPCGNGALDKGEACDDGNTAGGDGCSAGCQHEWCVLWASSTLAGDGKHKDLDGKGESAGVYYPCGIAVDPQGNVYVIGRTPAPRLRKITPDGTVTTVAGGTEGYLDGIGAAAKFNEPCGLAVDGGGNVFVADRNNMVIRKVTPTGETSTFAGKGGEGGWTDGLGASARLYYPTGLALAQGGLLVVGDTLNHALRSVTPLGNVVTLAGAGPSAPGALQGIGKAAKFNEPMGVAALGDVLFVADRGNSQVRRIDPGGVVTLLAGDGKKGYVNGSGKARFDFPEDLAVDSRGILYVADSENHRIRRVSPQGNVSLAIGAPADPPQGTASGDAVGLHTAARFHHPSGIAWRDDGTFFVADTYNSRVRRLDCKQWSSAACGDGALDASETCDDGNLLNGDGCSKVCQVE